MNQRSLENYLVEDAAQSSVQFIKENCTGAEMFSSTKAISSDVALLEACLDAAANEIRKDATRMVLSFGVGTGAKLSTISRALPSETIFGFDHYNGLSEDWTLGRKAGFGSMGGLQPNSFRENVILQTGEFDVTLPTWLREHTGKNMGLLHLNVGSYTPTKYILDTLQSLGRFVVGTMIVIETFFNYPGWENHSRKAVDEWSASLTGGMVLDYNRFASPSGSVCIRLREGT